MGSSTVIELLQSLIYCVLIGAIPILSKYVIQYLEQKREQVKENTENSSFTATVDKAVSLICQTVDLVQQTYVDELKKAGNFTKEDHTEAFEMASNLVMEMLDTETKELLTTAYSDLDSWIEVQIESYILSKKENNSNT
jgi:hypothetical protein